MQTHIRNGMDVEHNVSRASAQEKVFHVYAKAERKRFAAVTPKGADAWTGDGPGQFHGDPRPGQKCERPSDHDDPGDDGDEHDPRHHQGGALN
jgi:hypothetical protein